MNEHDTFYAAIKRLAPDLDTNGDYVAYGRGQIVVDGSFTLAELEAIVAAAKEAEATLAR